MGNTASFHATGGPTDEEYTERLVDFMMTEVKDKDFESTMNAASTIPEGFGAQLYTEMSQAELKTEDEAALPNAGVAPATTSSPRIEATNRDLYAVSLHRPRVHLKLTIGKKPILKLHPPRRPLLKLNPPRRPILKLNPPKRPPIWKLSPPKRRSGRFNKPSYKVRYN